MNKIERIYREKIAAMTPQERVMRSISLYNQVHEMLRVKILRESPSLSPRELRLRVAQRMYLTDPKTQGLLKRLA